MEKLKHQLDAKVTRRNVQKDCETYVFREPDVAYNAHFNTEKELLSMKNGVYFDENIVESIG